MITCKIYNKAGDLVFKNTIKMKANLAKKIYQSFYPKSLGYQIVIT